MIGRVTQQSVVSDFTNNTLRREGSCRTCRTSFRAGTASIARATIRATINYMDLDSRMTERYYSSIIGVMQNKHL
jgi:hypothetical protein